MQKIIKIFSKIILIFFISIILFSCEKNSNKSFLEKQINNNNFFIVLPHHSLTWENINNFYKEFALKKSKKIDNIVIISPNHYWEGIQFMESFKEDWKYCFWKNWDKYDEKSCINWKKLGFYNYKKSEMFDLVDYENPKKNIFTKNFLTFEHWIWEHFFYIKKYFWDKNIYSLVLRRELEKFPKTEEIFEKLKNYEKFKKNTLFIASVDFSHHIPEKMAIFHDMKTIEELNKKDFKIAEVDCPNCLYLIKKLARNNNKKFFNLKNRSSTSTINKKDALYENTSHIFGEFKNKQEKNNLVFFKDKNIFEQTQFLKQENKAGSWSIYGIFFGDSHLTRSFLYTKKYKNIPISHKNKEKYFECFYQNHDLKKKPEIWINRIFYGFDFSWINLETALCSKKNIINSQKSVKLRTEEENLKYFKKIWINMVSLANNHFYDFWNKCFSEAKKILKKNKIYYFGEGRGQESNILKREVNGLKIAFMWINDTTYPWSLAQKIKKIKKLKKDWYLIILNLHSGLEYQTKHNKNQEKISHSLVDAGVNLIIWHHPHVIQDYEVYNWVPIFYSLGNFIFDQADKRTLKGMWVVFRIDKFWVRFNRIYFDRKKSDFSIDCLSFR